MNIGSSLDYADSVVAAGACVVSADSSSVLALVQETMTAGRSATFYVSRDQYDAIRSWYWTQERRAELGMEEVGAEERARIERELGARSDGLLSSNRIPCSNCGHIYGAFEFIQQGIRDHGHEMVERVLQFTNTAVVQVNQQTVAICPVCDQAILPEYSGKISPNIVDGTPIHKHYYEFDNYGCCVLSSVT